MADGTPGGGGGGDISPNSKKQSIINEILEIMDVPKALFLDDDSFYKYQLQLSELKGHARSLAGKIINFEQEIDQLKEAKRKRDTLVETLKKSENLMFFRSAIEILEKTYIPNDDTREGMNRIQRWQHILSLSSESVRELRRKISKHGESLELNNFPYYVLRAYETCNAPIHEYFAKKSVAEQEIYAQKFFTTLHFGQNLSKKAMEFIIECLNIERSPNAIMYTLGHKRSRSKRRSSSDDRKHKKKRRNEALSSSIERVKTSHSVSNGGENDNRRADRERIARKAGTGGEDQSSEHRARRSRSTSPLVSHGRRDNTRNADKSLEYRGRRSRSRNSTSPSVSHGRRDNTRNALNGASLHDRKQNARRDDTQSEDKSSERRFRKSRSRSKTTYSSHRSKKSRSISRSRSKSVPSRKDQRSRSRSRSSPRYNRHSQRSTNHR